MFSGLTLCKKNWILIMMNGFIEEQFSCIMIKTAVEWKGH